MNRPRFCSFIVAVILRVGLAIQVTGCATVGLPSPTIADVRDTVSVVLQLTLLLAVVALVITIVRRSFRKRHGTVIVPFDVNSPDGKYSGKAIADAIASELMRIQRMHSTELFKEWKLDNPQFGERRKLAGVLPRRSKPVTMPPLQSKADAGARIPDVAVELAGTKFSLASVMQGIQYLWTGRDPEVVVTGSLQVFGKHVRIVARLDRAGASLEGEPERSSSCIIREAASKIETEDQIPDLLRDLTFQLWMELLDPKLRFTKTWQGLKHFTDALAGYEDFSVSGTSDDLDRATDRAFAAVRAEPNTTAFFNLLFQLGGHHSELGKYEEAARLLDQAVKLRSVGEASSTDDTVGAELAQAYNALGVCYAYQGDYPHAEVSFRRALRHNERMIEAYTNLALIYRSQEPESADERETELELLLEAAGNRGALSALSKDELGKWYLQLGLIDRGVEALHASDDVLGRLQLARALADSGKPREAIDECCTLLKRTADSEDASILARVRNELGMLLSDQGSLPEAVSQYSLAIKLDPDYADPHNNLGVVHQGQERFQDARDEFKRAIALDPELTVARYNLADLYRGLGLDELAVAQFRRLLTLDPSRSDAHYWLGIIYDKHDETDQALSHMERAVQLDLTGSAGRDYLAYLYDKKERFDDALTQINHVIADDPANLRAWAFRAHLYRRLGRLGDAEVQVKAAQARKAELMTQPDGKPFEDDYQEACFEALCGKPDAALEKLAAALAAGLRTPESVRVDTDFVALRDDPRFKALVEKPGMTRTR